MEVEVGLHQTSPPSGYTICEHPGTASTLFQYTGLPATTVADLGAELEYATEAFRTLGIDVPFSLNKRNFSWNLLVTSFLFDETNVSTATNPSESPCKRTE